ncbi:MAG: amidohydrolase [Phycisphaerales bacterium]|nr:amidohydrolase [Phycisphaerales bacterium]
MHSRDGRIAALDAPPAGERIIDLRGRTVLPGLIDSHLHLVQGAETAAQLDLSTVRSRDAFEHAVAERHAALPPDAWLLAGGWSESNWPDHVTPDSSWLRAAGDRPCVCLRSDLHVALVNDAVLARCVTLDDPPGGEVRRDPRTGAPTGLMVESAAWTLVNPLLPRPDAATRRELTRAAAARLHRFGVTTVGSMEYGAVVRDVLEPLRESLDLRVVITLLDRDWPLDFEYGEAFRNDDRLAVLGYKSFLDGTLGSRTARLRSPYADAPDRSGQWVELAERGLLQDWIAAVAARGFSPSMHAIGDAAARLALDVAEALPPGAHVRFEHMQQLDLADVPRLRGRIASMQPLHKADDGRMLASRVGPARLAGSFAFRRLLDAGATLAFGSDWPVVSADPMLGIRAAVTGLTVDDEPCLVDQNLTVDEALTAYTAGAATGLACDDRGRLTPGRLADFVVLDRDPFTTDWSRDVPRVIMTVVGGRIVFADEASWTEAELA